MDFSFQPLHKLVAVAIATLSFGIVMPGKVDASLIWEIGINNNNNSELEQEGGIRNDRNYYWENGDYTTVVGLNGAGVNWTSGMEIWQDGPNAADWDDTIDGFPRALTTGVTTNNIFFQFDASEVAPTQTLIFNLDVQGGKANTTHDLDFLLNGTVFHTVTGRNVAPGFITATIDPGTFGGGLSAGPAVLSMQRTGGVVTSGSAWITFDQLSLTSVPEPSTGVGLVALISATLAGYRRRRSLAGQG